MATSPTALTQAQQERVRVALQELRQKTQNQTELARLLSVKQQSVSRALSSGGPIGIRLASAVAAARGQALEDLLQGRRPPRTFSESPGWAQAAAEVQRERRASPGAVAAVGRWPAFLDVDRVEPKLVLDLAALWTAWAPLSARMAAEHADDKLPPPKTQELPIVPSRRSKPPEETG